MNYRVFVGTEQSSKTQDGASQQHMNEKCDYSVNEKKQLYGGSYFTVLHQQEQYLKFIYNRNNNLFWVCGSVYKN